MRILTFNILHRDHTPHDRYPFCNPQYLTWEYRYPRIIEKILAPNADIICLQEIDAYQVDQYFIEPLAQHGYQCTLQEHRSGKRKLYKYIKELDQNPLKPNTIICAIFYRNMELLHTIVGSRTLCVVLKQGTVNWIVTNVHLEAHWNMQKERVKHIQKLCDKLSGEKIPQGHIIICGDFNSEPDNELFIIMETHGYRNGYTAKKRPPWSFSAPGRLWLLDYFLYKSTCDGECTLSIDWNHLPQRELIPNSNHPSDHRELWCDFKSFGP